MITAETTVAELNLAAGVALQQSLGLQHGETILIVMDQGTIDVGQALARVARLITPHVFLMEMPIQQHHGQEPPVAVAEAMANVHVAVLPTTMSLTHTQARIQFCKFGGRVASLPGITPQIFAQLGGVDLEALATRTSRLASFLREGREFRVTTKAGTDMTFERGERRVFEDCGRLSAPRAGGNLPPGEAFFAPADRTARGQLVIDVSMASIGLLSSPIQVVVNHGVGVRFTGGSEAETLLLNLIASGPNASRIAEFGIGTLPIEGPPTGNILSDEKRLGTCHFAFGNNCAMGGTNDVKVHLDGIIADPTILVDSVMVMRDGKLLV